MPDLRALLAAATPGPWRVEDDWSDYGGVDRGPEGSSWIDPHGAYSSERADNELMALAPDLARLVLEAEEAMRAIVEIDATSSYKSIYSCPGEMASFARDFLARSREVTGGGA
jgi:hypothetical protein